MAKVIAIANQKGGATKSTTALALAAGLQLNDKKTLFIDTDPQCNSSDTYQALIEGVATLYDLLKGEVTAKNTIQHTSLGDIIPCDPLLSEAEKMLTNTGREYALKKALKPILDEYDYIIIDTPPALGVLLINALTVANTVIVPITAERYSLQGLSQFMETVKAAQEYTNPDLTISGLLLTRYDSRTNISKEVSASMPAIADQLNTVVFETRIRESVATKEAQALRTSLYSHAPSSTTARDYLSFVDEIIERGI